MNPWNIIIKIENIGKHNLYQTKFLKWLKICLGHDTEEFSPAYPFQTDKLSSKFDKKFRQKASIYRCVLFRLLEPRLKYWFWQILIWIFVDPSCRLGRADGQRGESQSPILSRRNKLSQKGNNFLIERTMQDIRFVCCVWRLDLDALGKWSQQVDIDYACLLCLAIIYSLSIIASTACKEIVSKISKKKWRSTVYWYY